MIISLTDTLHHDISSIKYSYKVIYKLKSSYVCHLRRIAIQKCVLFRKFTILLPFVA